MKGTYYNTNKESGELLSKSKKKVASQENRIMMVMAFNPDIYFTAESLQKYLFEYDVPLTSVRRALSNLKRSGFIYKADKMTQGKYGKKVHTWKVTKQIQIW